jgi:hypothetical protein
VSAPLPLVDSTNASLPIESPRAADARETIGELRRRAKRDGSWTLSSKDSNRILLSDLRKKPGDGVPLAKKIRWLRRARTDSGPDKFLDFVARVTSNRGPYFTAISLCSFGMNPKQIAESRILLGPYQRPKTAKQCAAILSTACKMLSNYWKIDWSSL